VGIDPNPTPTAIPSEKKTKYQKKDSFFFFF